MSLGRTLSLAAGAAFGGAVGVLVVGTAWIGRGYFALPRDERPAHELHAMLAPGAPWGVLLGLLGTALMLAMLLYTVRKALVRARWLGPPGRWLWFHVICGLGGPACIVLHAGVTWPRGLVSVGFWCMVLVAASGAFGRWVYGLLPRATGGRELAWDAAKDRLADLRSDIVEATAGFDPRRLVALSRALTEVTEFQAEVATVPALFRLQGELRRRRRATDAHLEDVDLDPGTRKAVRSAILEQLRLKRGLEASRVAHRLFRYWHLFHRPLAGAMYVIVMLHVAGAVLLAGSLSALSGL